MSEFNDKPKVNCRFWHRKQVVKDTGKNRYIICKDCGSRSVKSYGDGYQPVDQEWLDSGRGEHGTS